MAYIGKTPTPAPLTSSDITNGIVTGEKLNADVISSQTELATEPADTDEFLISDAGTLKRIDASLVVGGGKINQVVSTTKTDTWSSSGTGTFQAVTGLSVAITPTATSSKVYVNVDLTGYINDYGGGFSIYRDGSAIVAPTSPSSRSIANAGHHTTNTNFASAFGHSYLDSPSSTSALTYQVYVFARSSTYYINRSSTDSDTNDYIRAVSTITAFEVLA